MGKTLKSQPFAYLGNYPDIDAISKLVSGMTDTDWTKFTYRQKNIVGHKSTQTIPLMFDHLRKNRDIRHEQYETFAMHLQKISTVLAEQNYASVIKRANLVKLFSYSEISAHTDVGDFLTQTRRIHLPIHTNPQCTFTVGNETKHLPIGQLWEINNTGLVHSVHNNGNTDRVHLVIDVG